MSAAQGRDLAALRELNTRAVLAALYSADAPMTITELSKLTTVSRPTVQATIDALLQGGFALESDAPAIESRMGRPARTFALNAGRNIVAGLDIGPHGIVGLLADLRGTVLAEQRSSEDLSDGSAAFDAMTATVDRLLAEVDRAEVDLTALSVGVPGIVTSGGEISLTTVVPDWLRSDLTARLRSRYAGASVFFDNDTKLAAVAEHQFGSAQGLDDFVFLFLSERIAAASFVRGQLLRGANGAASEIGAMASFGWPEAYDRYRSRVRDAEGQVDEIETASTSFATEISQGLSALCLALDPAAVVIAGEPLQSEHAFVQPLHDELSRTLLYSVPLRGSTLRSLAVARGAIGRAIEEIRARLLG